MPFPGIEKRANFEMIIAAEKNAAILFFTPANLKSDLETIGSWPNSTLSSHLEAAHQYQN